MHFYRTETSNVVIIIYLYIDNIFFKYRATHFWSSLNLLHTKLLLVTVDMSQQYSKTIYRRQSGGMPIFFGHWIQLSNYEQLLKVRPFPQRQ